MLTPARSFGRSRLHTWILPGVTAGVNTQFAENRESRKTLYLRFGWVAEWSKAAVLKTAVGESLPGVRIPPHPLFASCRRSCTGFFVRLTAFLLRLALPLLGADCGKVAGTLRRAVRRSGNQPHFRRVVCTQKRKSPKSLRSSTCWPVAVWMATARPFPAIWVFGTRCLPPLSSRLTWEAVPMNVKHIFYAVSFQH